LAGSVFYSVYNEVTHGVVVAEGSVAAAPQRVGDERTGEHPLLHRGRGAEGDVAGTCICGLTTFRSCGTLLSVQLPVLNNQSREKKVVLPPVGWSEGKSMSTGDLIESSNIPFEKHPEQSVPEGFAAGVLKLVRDRGSAYGAPHVNHQLTADIWSMWLSRHLRQEIKITPETVCMLNVLQKASRLAFGTKDDSWADVLGYGENVAMLMPEQRNVR
jgi:hypothetical protein